MKKCSTIDDLYYGNISPSEKPYDKTSEYGQLREESDRLEDELRKQLSAEALALFEKLQGINSEASAIELVETFGEGFRLGLRLGEEVWNEDGAVEDLE